ncbi:DUF6297 family protein [Streptosporangium sp. NBC_01469]|uniref:DUF6297 family protein n=1 Tax=Streptosporangium sp. NBC_01469 TaxID=2903898 RepID=UPI002E2C6C72|nr:DUF6297 family protein [Streptosporangium sp. NBC_01469]
MSTARSARAFVRARGSAPASWLDRYTTLFGLAILLAVLAQPASSALASLARQADPSRTGAGLALVMLAYAGLLIAARALGPVALPAADAAWLLLSPLRRRGVLGRTATLLLVLAVLAGAALGVGALTVLGAPDQLALRLVTAVLLGVSASVGGMALAMLSQSSQSWQPWLNAAVVVTALLAAVAALSALSGPARRFVAEVANAPAPQGVPMAGLAVAAAALLAWRAWSALAGIPARAVLSASTRAGHVSTAAVGMDPGALTWIAEDNHWRGRTLRSRPWPPLPAPLALAWQDWRRLGRRPGRLAALLGGVALPVLAASAAGEVGAVVTGVVFAGALTATVAGISGARRDGDNPGLARLLGVGARSALAARSLLPALLGGAWLTLALACMSLAGALGTGPWWLFGPLAAPALAAGGLRMARRSPIDHTMPIIETPAGTIPIGPLIWGMTGVDLALLGCLPLVLALGPQPSFPTALLVVQALTGTAVLLGYLLRAGAARR